MFVELYSFISKFLQRKSTVTQRQAEVVTIDVRPDALTRICDQTRENIDNLNLDNLVAYDKNLLERSRTQWQFGDWSSLAELSHETLQYHPDRAKLALLAAVGKIQNNQITEAKQLIQSAQGWGASKKLTSQIIISSTHNTIGRAWAAANLQNRSLLHFEKSISIGAPECDPKLLLRVRVTEQYSQLGLPTSDGYVRADSTQDLIKS